MVNRKGYSFVHVQMHFRRRKDLSETNVTSHALQPMLNLKIFPECFRGPLNTLWRATCGRRACGWATLH